MFVGAGPPGREKKKPNKPDFVQPVLSQWVAKGSLDGGAASPATVSPIASSGYEGPRATGGPGPRNSDKTAAIYAGSDEGSAGTMGATKTTKRSQFPLTIIKSSNLHCCGRVPQGRARTF